MPLRQKRFTTSKLLTYTWLYESAQFAPILPFVGHIVVEGFP